MLQARPQELAAPGDVLVLLPQLRGDRALRLPVRQHLQGQGARGGGVGVGNIHT